MIPAAQPAERSVSMDLPTVQFCSESDLTPLVVFRFEQ
jgi:hypothetical protein